MLPLILASLLAIPAPIVLPQTSGGAQAPPPCLASGDKTVTRQFSATPSATTPAPICRVLDSGNPGVDHDSFPVPGNSSPRLVYYRVAIDRPTVSGGRELHADTVLTLLAKSFQDLFSITVYDEQGSALMSTYRDRADQQLLLVGSDFRQSSYLVEVQFENPPPKPETRSGGFTLVRTVSKAVEPTRSNMRAFTPVVQAYASRRMFDAPEYDSLVTFATCDTANTDDSNVCRIEIEQETHRLFDRLVPRDVAEDEEPVIAFVGIGGANRIVLINKRGMKEQTNPATKENVKVASYTPRNRRTLPTARWFWALFVEDDLSPFETSIDVEFKPRAAVSEIDEFDPSSLVSLGMAGAKGLRRAVRVGMRRVRVRNPPVAVEVAFSRIGAGYGVRQWRQVYRMRSWNPVSFGAGLFVPFTTVRVETHDLHVPGLASGEVPDFAVITPRWHRRQIFAMGQLFVPSWRNMRDEAVDTRQKFWGTVLPHAVVGLGLPAEGGQAYYAGLGWNVAWERLGITVGGLLSEQSHLRGGFGAGDRLRDKQTPISTFAETKMVGTLLFGVTVDLLRVR